MLGFFGLLVGYLGLLVMYNYSFEKVGINDVYLVFDIQVDEMVSVLIKMCVLNMCGVNVMMFCKKVVVELVDELLLVVELIGVVNMIVNNDGVLVGYNMDGVGYVENLCQYGVDLQGKCFMVLGVGGVVIVIVV